MSKPNAAPKYRGHRDADGNVFRYANGKTPTDVSYEKMKCRIFNVNHNRYPQYGGRGIKIAARWLGKEGFANFMADMGERPEGMSLDRIDVNGEYEPSNCRWATPKEQSENKQKSKNR